MFLTVAIFGEVVATSAIKASDGFTKLLPSCIVVVGYLVAFYFMSLALRTIPIGIAYAVWSGLGIVFITTFAWFYYGQKLDLGAIVGIALIILGVIIMNTFSHATAH